MKPNLLNSVKLQKPRSNEFDMSHDLKTTCNMGNLVPIMCMEVVPGDKIDISGEALIRLAPMVSPVMHRVNVFLHYFFVPNRILWPDWETFITGSLNGQSIDPSDLPAPPELTISSANYSSLPDWMGIPIPIDANTETVSALPFAAFQKIYDDFYRDENLILSDWEPLNDGDNTDTNPWLLTLRNRCWEHDYFTASLPFAQKGAPVSIPIGDISLKPDWFDDSVPKPHWVNTVGIENNVGALSQALEAVTNDPIVELNAGGIYAYDPADTLEATSTTINDLRTAYRLQEFLERGARAGTRYVESILGHFGVRSSDQRLQRPEYITGAKAPIIISEVLQTSESDTSPQGNMAGHGVSTPSGRFGAKFCEEHGYIIGIMSVMPKTAYQQGIERHFLKFDHLDYFWPEFAHLGEQAVANREIYAFRDTADEGSATFGYVPRYAEYKFMNNRVSGQFRTTLSFWHLGRIFSTPPALNDDFVISDPREDIFAVTDPSEDHLYCHILNKVRARRLMPRFGTPRT